MNRKRRLSFALAMGVAVLCSAASPAVSEQDAIRIAVAGPMSGPYAAVGDQMRLGAEMAVADINASGGLLNRRVVLQIEDDACEPKQAMTVAARAVADGVVFVAGHLCSSSSILASEIYAERGVIQISPGSTNPTLTEQGLKNVFRICGRDDQQGRAAGKRLAARYAGERIAILHDKSAYGRGLAEQTRNHFRALGGTEVLYEAYTSGEKDYEALVTRLKAVGAQVVYIGGRFTEMGLIIRQAHEQGLKAQFIGGDTLATTEFWKITGTAGEGVLMTFLPEKPRDTPAMRSLIDRFKDLGHDPEAYTLYTYGAVEVWAAAVKKAGTTKTISVAKALRANPYQTVLGEIDFDDKGDIKSIAYVFYRWSNGRYVLAD